MKLLSLSCNPNQIIQSRWTNLLKTDSSPRHWLFISGVGLRSTRNICLCQRCANLNMCSFFIHVKKDASGTDDVLKSKIGFNSARLQSSWGWCLTCFSFSSGLNLRNWKRQNMSSQEMIPRTPHPQKMWFFFVCLSAWCAHLRMVGKCHISCAAASVN